MVLFARDVAEPVFLSLPPEVNALEAARQMKQKHQGYVIIIDKERPVGIVTEWDYLAKVVAEGKDPSSMSLKDLMTEGLISVPDTEGLEGVARIMTERGVRRVLVIQKDKVIGVITSRTILARLDEYIDKVSVTIARLQSPPS